MSEPDLIEVTTAELAGWLGITAGRIRQLRQNGIFPAVKRGERVNLKDHIARYIESIKKPDPEIMDARLAKARLLQAQATRAERQLLKDERLWWPAATAHEGFMQVIGVYRDFMNVLPDILIAHHGIPPSEYEAVRDTLDRERLNLVTQFDLLVQNLKQEEISQ